MSPKEEEEPKPKLKLSEKVKIKKWDALQSFYSEHPNATPQELIDVIIRLNSQFSTPKSISQEEITRIEFDVNTRAKAIAKRLGYDEIPFQVYFMPMERWWWKIRRGTTVEIYTSVLPDHPEFEQTLRYYLSKLETLWDSSDLNNVDYVHSLNVEAHKKFRETYTDLSEVIPMLPKHRLHIIDYISVIVRDIKHNISITVSGRDYPGDTTERLAQRARFMLSRKIMLEFKEDWWSVTEEKECESMETK